MLTEEMVDRLRAYGSEEIFPADATLFAYSDKTIDLFLMLECKVHVSRPPPDDDHKVSAWQEAGAYWVSSTC